MVEKNQRKNRYFGDQNYVLYLVSKNIYKQYVHSFIEEDSGSDA